jgi:hypothetical protein
MSSHHSDLDPRCLGRRVGRRGFLKQTSALAAQAGALAFLSGQGALAAAQTGKTGGQDVIDLTALFNALGTAFDTNAERVAAVQWNVVNATTAQLQLNLDGQAGFEYTIAAVNLTSSTTADLDKTTDVVLGGLVLVAMAAAMLAPARGVGRPDNAARAVLELQRRVSLYANAEGRPAGDVGTDVQKLVEKLGPTLPPGYRFDVGGQTREMNESFAAAVGALGIAVIFIYLILASQFGSFTHPLAIMLSLPLSLVGVAVMLFFTKDTLNIMSMIGLIMLMGLVTKNAILLVDFTNHSRAKGMSRHQALLQAGTTRLRPIVMTTLAMIFGMLPLAFAIGAGAEMRAPMARAVIGGLITSTLLSLLVVPVVYTFLDDFRPSAVLGWVTRRKPSTRH